MSLVSAGNGNGSGSNPITDSSISNLPWVEKYRPLGLDEVSHHQDIIQTLRRFVVEGKLPHLLLYGPPGTGKTSTALALAKEIFGTKKNSTGGNVLELNASDERGIDVVREQIKSFASSKTLFGAQKFKLIILDECDAMTSVAQNALRRVMERWVKNVRFILICNYVNQIIPPLQSRCTRFRFSPLPRPSIEEKIFSILKEEDVRVIQDSKLLIDSVIKISNGDMRRVLNVLQAASAARATPDTPLSEDMIYAVTATPHPAELDNLFSVLMSSKEYRRSLEALRCLQIEKGLALTDLLTAMVDRICMVDLPGPRRIALTKKLADIEHRLSLGSSEKIQGMAMVGAFITSLSV